MPILKGRIGSLQHHQRIALLKNPPLSRTKSDANRNYSRQSGSGTTVKPHSYLVRTNNLQNVAASIPEYRRTVYDNLTFTLPPAPFYSNHSYNPNYPGFPWQVLTLVRFIQLLEINVAMYTLSQNNIFLEQLGVTGPPYERLVLAFTIYIFFWLIEENVIRTLKMGSSFVLLFGMTTISFIYVLTLLGYLDLTHFLQTICSSYIAIVLYVNFNYYQAVTFGATLISALYFGYHLHWTAESARVTLAVDRLNGANLVINFHNTTRPGTNDTRLNIGPQLVFPIPKEYSVPEQSE